MDKEYGVYYNGEKINSVFTENADKALEYAQDNLRTGVYDSLITKDDHPRITIGLIP